jgi:hypothetical protein
VTVDPVVGKWFGRVNREAAAMEFRADGRLAYVVLSEGKCQTVVLTWRREGDIIVTDQPSLPSQERTSARFVDGRLLLTFDGVETWWDKQ